MLRLRKFMQIQPIFVNSVQPCNFVQSPQLFRNFGHPPVSSTNHSSPQSPNSLPYFWFEDADMSHSNVSHLPTKITAKDGEKQFLMFFTKAELNCFTPVKYCGGKQTKTID